MKAQDPQGIDAVGGESNGRWSVSESQHIQYTIMCSLGRGEGCGILVKETDQLSYHVL